MMNWPISYILKAFFLLLYHQMAWIYDAVASIVSVGLWSKWVQTSYPYIQGPRVLEIGHGPGHLQIALLKQGFEIFGIDESRQMGRIAKAKIENSSAQWKNNHGYAQSGSLSRALAQTLPFPPAAFNTIVSTFPTLYIFEAATIQSIYRVLCPGGRLVIVLSGEITGRSPLHRLAAFLFRLTGESDLPVGDFETPFTTAGFRLESQWINLETSRVLLLLAEKP